jgi:hypothetical protein
VTESRPVVLPGHDQITRPGHVAVRELDQIVLAHRAERSERIPGPTRKIGRLHVRPGHQQRLLAAEVVGQPPPDRRSCHLLGSAFQEPAALVVFGEHVGVACAQPQRGLALPLGVKPLDRDELVVAVLVGEQPHRPARPGRRQLRGVAGQQDLRPDAGRDRLDGGQVAGRDHRRLVDHEQITRPHRQVAAGPVAVLDPAEEDGEVAAVRQSLGRESVRRARRGGQPDHAADPGAPPGSAQDRDGTRLPRADGPIRMSTARPEVRMP